MTEVHMHCDSCLKHKVYFENIKIREDDERVYSEIKNTIYTSEQAMNPTHVPYTGLSTFYYAKLIKDALAVSMSAKAAMDVWRKKMITTYCLPNDFEFDSECFRFYQCVYKNIAL